MKAMRGSRTASFFFLVRQLSCVAHLYCLPLRFSNALASRLLNVNPSCPSFRNGRAKTSTNRYIDVSACIDVPVYLRIESCEILSCLVSSLLFFIFGIRRHYCSKALKFCIALSIALLGERK